MSTRLILDCDTGTDDAVAIICAASHPELELLAVTCVNGNVALPHVVDNTLRALDLAGASNVPAYAGAQRPLVRADLPIPRHVLNADDPDFHPDELPFPASPRASAGQAAARFLVDFYADPANADVVLVPTGPLTNVALALSLDPGLVDHVDRVVLMGGAIGTGNVTASAEFNFWCDPDAAAVVLRAGWRDLVVVPLEATHCAQVRAADCDRIAAIGGAAAGGIADLLRHRIEHDRGTGDIGQAGAPVHDAVCIAHLVDPGVVTLGNPHDAAVECAGTETLGRLVLDDRPWAPPPTAPIRVATSADRDRFVDFMCAALGERPHP